MPRLLIIQATGYRYRGLCTPYKLRKRKLVGAVIPYLAALAPKGWTITLIDDATEEVDFNADVDVVAIAIRTVTSFRGYEIADAFRRRGIPVLMGGPHTTFHAEEVAEPCRRRVHRRGGKAFSRKCSRMPRPGGSSGFIAGTRLRVWRIADSPVGPPQPEEIRFLPTLCHSVFARLPIRLRFLR